MKAIEYPAQQELRSLFRYEDGQLFWMRQPSPRARVDIAKSAGAMKKDGYVRVRFRSRDYFLHRLIWILHNGAISDGLDVDHIDGIKSNSAINNLQLLTCRQNIVKSVLQSARAHNTSGFRGVYYEKTRGNYLAQLKFNGRHILSRRIPTFEEAKRLRLKAEAEHWLPLMVGVKGVDDWRDQLASLEI